MATLVRTPWPISARWQGSVEAEDIVLFLDSTDVSAMAVVQPGGLTYNPVMALSPGRHSVRLSLGAVDRSWNFEVAGAPAGAACSDAMNA